MAAVDDTARERAEAVARAISYCKDTLRRGKWRSRSRSPSPPPPPSPSLDDWLHDRQEDEIIATAAVHCDECSDPRPSPPSPSPSLDDWLDDRDRQEVIIASAAEQHCDDCRARDSRPSPTRPRRDRDAGLPLGIQTRAKRFKELPCPASPSREDGSLAATAVAHGEESPHHGHGCRGDSMSSLDKLEFLKAFDGDEEMINHHFITLEIRRSGSQVFRKSPFDMKRKRYP